MSGFRDWFTHQRRQVSKMGKLSSVELSERRKEKRTEKSQEPKRDDFVAIDLGSLGAVCKRCFLRNGVIPLSKIIFLTRQRMNQQGRIFTCNNCGCKIS